MGAERAVKAKTSEASTEAAAPPVRTAGGAYSGVSPVEQILDLQKTVGNREVGRLFKSGAIQAKLNVGRPGDVYEQEADRLAERVMRMPGPAIQPKPT